MMRLPKRTGTADVGVEKVGEPNTYMSTELLVEALAKNAQFHVIEAPAEILALVRRDRPERPAHRHQVGR